MIEQRTVLIRGMIRGLITAMITAMIGLPAQAAPATVQRVVLSLSSVDIVPESVRATVQQDGLSTEILLQDNGSDANDAMGDRVYTGSLQGAPAQYLGVRLIVGQGGQEQEVYTGTLHVGLEPMVQVGFELRNNAQGRMVAWRRASLSPGRMSDAVEALPLMAATAWALLLLVWGSLQLRRPG